MPTIDLRDPALREKYGLRQENDVTVTRPSRVWWKEFAQERRSRGDAQRLILETLCASDRPLSRRQICKVIQRSDSPHFRHMLAELVALGCVVEIEQPYRSNISCFLYEAV